MKTALFALLTLAACCLAFAQAPPAPESAPVQAAAAAPAEGPVPVPVPDEKTMRYYRSGIVVWLVGLAWGVALPAIVLFTGLSAWLRDRARAIGRNWFFTIAIYWVLFSVVTAILDFPLSYYTEFVRQHEYGLSNQALSKYLQDSAISLAIGCVVGALLLWIPFLLLKKLPRSWWLVTSVLAVPFIVLQLLVTPLYIAPLFNTFGPMKDKALEAKILAIAERSGIEGGDVFEVEKSVDTKTVNAYVTGIFGTKRIVLWDTLLQKLNERQVLFVMAHEMGHYVLNHVPKFIVFAVFLITFALYAVHYVSGSIIRRYEARIGFSSLADPAALPLILLIVSVLSIFLSPLMMAYSRHNEHEADRFALEITRDNHAGASAFARLAEENLGNPRPHWFLKLMRGSHPTLGDRIDFCNTYRPWNEGRPGTYEGLFKGQ